ncbi:MAG: ROK family protein [Capsulimonadales bacterium]|nr:ROK family protein [Capsulimonadales bacterium]
MEILGIDIGGSGIKGAPVETETGLLLAERLRIDTPQPATPTAVTETVARIADEFRWSGCIGCGFPAVVKNGIVMTAANIDPGWIGKNAGSLIAHATEAPRVVVGNDADVAGLAEMRFGAGKGNRGLVLMVTLGTGIGSGLYYNGVLIPNTEFGHIEIKGKVAEQYAAESVREREDLSWKEWADRLNRYLEKMVRLTWPDLIILGGGVSKKSEKFLPHLSVKAPVVIAHLKNDAGIIGAALFAGESSVSGSDSSATTTD